MAATARSAERRILCPVLIGREIEVGQLDAMLRESLEGHGHTLLVSGEAGVGKTAVLRYFAKEARAQGARALWGECTEIDARRPLGPFMDIARAANRVASLPTADKEMATTDRYRLYSAFTGLLGGLARDRPTVIVLEDLHWADEASLELFPHLARKLRDVPLLLVGTYRSDELHRRHPLRPVLAEVTKARVAEQIALRRLSEDEVAAFLSEAMHIGRPPSVALRQRMFETCEGNPLFMEEVLRALVERGDVEYRDGSWRQTKEVSDLAIPDTLRDAVGERFRTLSADGQNVLLHAAVIGQRFDFDLLVRVTGVGEASVIGALRAAIDAQLILEPSDVKGADQYVFRHALTRESILLELLQPERRRMHATVGVAIEATAGEDPTARAEELAYHFDESGDRARAFRYHDLAAHEAYRLFAFARAAAHLERALELADDDLAHLGELRLRLADALFLAGANQRALRAADDARRWFEDRGRTDRAGVALMRIAWNQWLLGETRLARKAALDAAGLLETFGESAELAAACAEVAEYAWLDYEFPTASAWGQRALDMARRTGALAAELYALNTLGSVEAWSGRQEGVARLREAITVAVAHGMVEVAVDAMANLTPALTLTGASKDERRRADDERLAYARHHGYLTEMVPSLEAYALCDDGDWDAALRLARESQETHWAAHLALVEAQIRVGREGPAVLSLLDAPSRRLRRACAVHQLVAAGNCARIALHAGEPGRALEYLDAVIDDLVRQPGPTSDAAIVVGVMAARSLREDAAIVRWIEIARTARGGAPLTVAARRSFAEAEHAADSGDMDLAIEQMTTSADLFAGYSPFPELFARRRLIELLVQRNDIGDRESAQAELSTLLPYWQRARATWYLGELELWARDLGLEFPRAVAPAQAELQSKLRLTPREKEVVALVANGLSNKDIAAKLVISERTAEGHVERILGKLGFRSRAQIASWQAGGDPTTRLS